MEYNNDAPLKALKKEVHKTAMFYGPHWVCGLIDWFDFID